MRVRDLDVSHAKDALRCDAGGVRAAAIRVEVGDPAGLALDGVLLAHDVVVALDGRAVGLVGERFAHDRVVRSGQELEAGGAAQSLGPASLPGQPSRWAGPSLGLAAAVAQGGGHGGTPGVGAPARAVRGQGGSPPGVGSLRAGGGRVAGDDGEHLGRHGALLLLHQDVAAFGHSSRGGVASNFDVRLLLCSAQQVRPGGGSVRARGGGRRGRGGGKATIPCASPASISVP